MMADLGHVSLPSDHDPRPVTWKGKPLTDMSRDELLEVAEYCASRLISMLTKTDRSRGPRTLPKDQESMPRAEIITGTLLLGLIVLVGVQIIISCFP